MPSDHCQSQLEIGGMPAVLFRENRAKKTGDYKKEVEKKQGKKERWLVPYRSVPYMDAQWHST